MNKFLVFFVGAILVTSSVFADISSTREVLRLKSDDNPNVLEVYDRITTSWSEYAESLSGGWNVDSLLSAIEYAAEKHEGQVRKDVYSTPYIVHPLGVAQLLWEAGNIKTLNVLTAAILHDTLEDTTATSDEIESLFGARILSIIQEVTNDPDLSSDENKAKQIEDAPDMSLDAQLVKLADRVYNVRDLYIATPSWSAEKIAAYYNWGELLLEALRGTNFGLELALENQINAYKASQS